MPEKINTVLFIEHEFEVMRETDHIIDMGLGAGHNGGIVVGEGIKQANDQSYPLLVGQAVNRFTPN